MNKDELITVVKNSLIELKKDIMEFIILCLKWNKAIKEQLKLKEKEERKKRMQQEEIKRNSLVVTPRAATAEEDNCRHYVNMWLAILLKEIASELNVRKTSLVENYIYTKCDMVQTVPFTNWYHAIYRTYVPIEKALRMNNLDAHKDTLQTKILFAIMEGKLVGFNIARISYDVDPFCIISLHEDEAFFLNNVKLKCYCISTVLVWNTQIAEWYKSYRLEVERIKKLYTVDVSGSVIQIMNHALQGYERYLGLQNSFRKHLLRKSSFKDNQNILHINLQYVCAPETTAVDISVREELRFSINEKINNSSNGIVFEAGQENIPIYLEDIRYYTDTNNKIIELKVIPLISKTEYEYALWHFHKSKEMRDMGQLSISINKKERGSSDEFI